MIAVEIGLLGVARRAVWTHVGYPLDGRARSLDCGGRRVLSEEVTPSVTVVVAAWNEEDVIERRLANLLELDYPAEKLEIVVASDASTDRTRGSSRASRAYG